MWKSKKTFFLSIFRSKKIWRFNTLKISVADFQSLFVPSCCQTQLFTVFQFWHFSPLKKLLDKPVRYYFSVKFGEKQHKMIKQVTQCACYMSCNVSAMWKMSVMCCMFCAFFWMEGSFHWAHLDFLDL